MSGDRITALARPYGSDVLPLRDENPIERTPAITVLLIVACIGIYIFAQAGLQGLDQVETPVGTVQLDSELRFSLEVAAIPCEIVEQRPLSIEEISNTYGQNATSNNASCAHDPAGPSFFPDKHVMLAIVSSLFLHGGLTHLGFNMLFLWIFGNNIEDRLGHIAFLAFYLTGGIIATIGHIMAQPSSTVAIVGASGAISAVMGAYLVWFPDAPIRTLVFLILVDIRARWFLASWFVLQFFTAPNSGIAWVAHVTGFAYGVIMGLLIRRHTWDRTGGVGRGPYPHPTDYVQ